MNMAQKTKMAAPKYLNSVLKCCTGIGLIVSIASHQ